MRMIRGVKLIVAVLGLCAAVSAQADGLDRRVRIINESEHTVMQLYASRVSTAEWEEDILGSSVLGAGAAVTANLDDGTEACLFDIKVVFDHGGEATTRLNVCKTANFYIR